MTLKERLRARSAKITVGIRTLRQLGHFLLKSGQNFPDVDRPMKNRRSQLPKNAHCEFPIFGAPRTLRRSLSVARRYRFSVPARTDPVHAYMFFLETLTPVLYTRT